jgi:hypothetical protein
MTRPLPTRDDVLRARDWLRAGAPAAPTKRAADAGPDRAVAVLLQLIEALPDRIPEYCYGYQPPGDAP